MEWLWSLCGAACSGLCGCVSAFAAGLPPVVPGAECPEVRVVVGAAGGVWGAVVDVGCGGVAGASGVAADPLALVVVAVHDAGDDDGLPVGGECGAAGGADPAGH